MRFSLILLITALATQCSYGTRVAPTRRFFHSKSNAQILRPAGNQSLHVGKYPVGYLEKVFRDFRPTKLGYDRFNIVEIKRGDGTSYQQIQDNLLSEDTHGRTCHRNHFVLPDGGVFHFRGPVTQPIPANPVELFKELQPESADESSALPYTEFARRRSRFLCGESNWYPADNRTVFPMSCATDKAPNANIPRLLFVKKNEDYTFSFRMEEGAWQDGSIPTVKDPSKLSASDQTGELFVTNLSRLTGLPSYDGNGTPYIGGPSTNKPQVRFIDKSGSIFYCSSK